MRMALPLSPLSLSAQIGPTKFRPQKVLHPSRSCGTTLLCCLQVFLQLVQPLTPFRKMEGKPGGEKGKGREKEHGAISDNLLNELRTAKISDNHVGCSSGVRTYS